MKLTDSIIPSDTTIVDAKIFLEQFATEGSQSTPKSRALILRDFIAWCKKHRIAVHHSYSRPGRLKRLPPSPTN